jgi:hypothetical protein
MKCTYMYIVDIELKINTETVSPFNRAWTEISAPSLPFLMLAMLNIRNTVSTTPYSVN